MEFTLTLSPIPEGTSVYTSSDFLSTITIYTTKKYRMKPTKLTDCIAPCVASIVIPSKDCIATPYDILWSRSKCGYYWGMYYVYNDGRKAEFKDFLHQRILVQLLKSGKSTRTIGSFGTLPPFTFHN